jgi:hypothetical protein
VIFRLSKENFYISNCPSLGEYLKNLPIDMTEPNIPQPHTENNNTKYTFIKNGGWKY